jgi:hypothetical protein
MNDRMATIKRLAVAVLTLAFLMGLTALSVTHASMAMVSQGGTLATGGMPDHSADPDKPCKNFAPCADHVGCVVLAALPAIPGSLPFPVDWASVEYRELALSPTGHSIEPELSPPILAA